MSVIPRQRKTVREAPAWALQLARALEAWLPKAARRLPWRTNLEDLSRGRDPWGALVAEAMLQQTQVSRVVEYFPKFIQRWPTPAALADADEREVLSAWAGLGYYRRARNLMAAARQIVERHGGETPRSAGELESLPGVGRYTAGAVASIAGGSRAAIVDGNVARVLLRVHGKRARAGAPATTRWAWSRAEELVRAADAPGVLNEAVMELGATVCVPGQPRCESCPVAALCEGRAKGIAAKTPLPAARVARTVINLACLVVADRRGRVLLVPRPATGLWAGLWQPPTVELPADVDSWARGYCSGPVRRVGEVRATLTHRLIRAGVYAGVAAECARKAGVQRWESPAALMGDTPSAGLSSFHRRVMRLALGG